LEVLEDRQAPATLIVNSRADTANPTDLYLSLREALVVVNSPSLPDGLSPQILEQIHGTLHEGGTDTIRFDSSAVTSPIVLGGTQLELSLPGSTASVTIDGGPTGVTVDGNDASRVLQVDARVQATLDHLTIVHGSLGSFEFGAGVYASNSTLTVSNCTLAGNSAFDGGGIYAGGGSLTVSNCTLTSNSAQAYSGGIEASVSSVTVSNTILTGNSAGYGGGIYGYASSVTVSNCTLQANYASGTGGGIAGSGGNRATVIGCTLVGNSVGRGIGGGIEGSSDGTLTVTDCILTGNSATDPYNGAGGGIVVDHVSLMVSHCTLAGNSATDGGGIYAYSSDATVSDTTLAGNSAVRAGGLETTFGGGATVSNCTLTNNSASGGGGILVSTARLTLSNCTVAGNSASAGGGIFASNTSASILLRNTIVADNTSGNAPDISGVVNSSSSYNLVGSGDGLSGISDGVDHNQVGTTDSPIDPLLTPLGYYGGPTQTHALLPGSPAREAGDPGSAPTLDQRGLPRIIAGHSDLGAFQTQADPFLVTTLQDPGQRSGLLSLREAVNLANVLPGDDTVSFDPALDGGLISLTGGQLELSGTGSVEAIDGAGRFTLDGNASTRLVQVDPGTIAGLRGLALINGNAPIGAGVYNRGTLRVADCVLYGNTGYAGGAFLNQGDLTVADCTIGFNVASLGAAIDNEGVLTAYNSTIGYNAALASGGALRNEPTGTARLTSLTISLNSAASGGGLDVAGGVVLLRNCIVAGNYSADASVPSDIAGSLARSSSYNLVGTGGSGGLLDGVNHNLVGVADAGLTAPDFGSDQTPAFGLTDDSPALGAGDPTLLNDPLLRLDQHGNVRTVVNIGAL
jgi:hypothetical protein